MLIRHLGLAGRAAGRSNWSMYELRSNAVFCLRKKELPSVFVGSGNRYHLNSQFPRNKKTVVGTMTVEAKAQRVPVSQGGCTKIS